MKYFALGCFAVSAVLAPAQTLISPPTAFQYFGFAGEKPGSVTLSGPVGLQGPAVTGRPMSATENRRTLQTLGDGTRIERREVSRYYRDTDGRTRVESENGEHVTISDMSKGSTTELNTSARTSRQTGFVRAFSFSGNTDKLEIPAEISAGVIGAVRGEVNRALGGLSAITPEVGTAFSIVRPLEATAGPRLSGEPKKEDLGIRNVNGVLAEGTRTTITIPVGEIGNDRPINIVNERWFSQEIGLLVKSVNSDPRFGETTFELTNIQRAAQDASLFQVPAGYSTDKLLHRIPPPPPLQ